MATNRTNLIAEKVCLFAGHSIGSIPKTLYDPITKTVIPDSWIGCVKCGMELEEIRSFVARAKRTKKAPPEVPVAIPQS